MSLGRRKVPTADQSRWVFNRIAEHYDARPPYPAVLIDAIAALTHPGAHVADLGAGIGHLAIPLAERGMAVTAIEPAGAMLHQLEAHGLSITTHRCAAEATPLAERSVDLAVLADALHFVDAERVGHELARILTPKGALAIVRVEPGDTPFMHDVVRAIERASPRRPRDTSATMRQLASLAGVELDPPIHFDDAVALDRPTLVRVFRSISFVGAAMNETRFEAFMADIDRAADAHGRIWARKIALHSGRRA